VAAFVLALSTGCKSGGGGAPSAPPGVTIEKLAVTSQSFPSNGAIPVDYSCDGADRSPQLTFSTPPRGTKTFAILVEDPDAPSGDFTHWTLYDISADHLAIPEGADPSSLGASSGVNDFSRPGYAGPCPPKMELHRYYFRVFALNAELGLPPDATRSAFDAALNGHVLAEGALVGEFSR
jgi:Raf kinase inhibitor-like YbhB/YbcL family protein